MWELVAIKGVNVDGPLEATNRTPLLKTCTSHSHWLHAFHIPTEMWNLTPINTWCRCFTDGMRCWIWVTFEVVGWYINIREWMLSRQVYEIVDLTLLIDQIHPSTLSFGSSISVTKLWASPLTLRCTQDDLLLGYSHFSLTTTSTNYLPCQYWHRDHDSSYSKLMVFIDSDDLSQTSRPLIHETVRSDDEMIYLITRIQCLTHLSWPLCNILDISCWQAHAGVDGQQLSNL